MPAAAGALSAATARAGVTPSAGELVPCVAHVSRLLTLDLSRNVFDGAARLAEGRRLDLQKEHAALVVEAQELLGALVAAAEPRELALVLDVYACA